MSNTIYTSEFLSKMQEIVNSRIEVFDVDREGRVIQPLKNVIEQRKIVAAAILKGDNDRVLVETYDALNKYIKAVLGIVEPNE